MQAKSIPLAIAFAAAAAGLSAPAAAKGPEVGDIYAGVTLGVAAIAPKGLELDVDKRAEGRLSGGLFVGAHIGALPIGSGWPLAVELGYQNIARHKATRTSARPGRAAVRYVQGDATALPFGDRSFDAVSIAFGIRNVAHPERAIAEFLRVLRPGGRLVVLEFADPANPVIRWLGGAYTRHVMPLTATLIARDTSGAYRYLPRSVSTFAQPQDLSRMLAGAGFADCSWKPLSMGICALHRAERPAVADTLGSARTEARAGTARAQDGSRKDG